MRLVTFIPPEGPPRAGALLGDTVIDLSVAAPLAIEEAEGLRWDLLSILRADQEEVSLDAVANIVGAVGQILGVAGDTAFDLHEDSRLLQLGGDLAGSLSVGGEAMLLPLDQVRLLAPLPQPVSLRAFDGFEEHAFLSSTRRGRDLPSLWYRRPGFSFLNHSAIIGPSQALLTPLGADLDYGLELACVIGRAGRDLSPDAAVDHIAGYIIANGWSAHDLTEDEQTLGTGPSQSRFATSLGPWLVTPDELELYADDDGRLSLAMIARVNGGERSRGNAGTLFFPFAELVAQASRNAALLPGDVITSGVVGGGCLRDLTDGYGPWLLPDDDVELEITGLGTLRNWVE